MDFRFENVRGFCTVSAAIPVVMLGNVLVATTLLIPQDAKSQIDSPCVFSPPVNYSTGQNPFSVAMGDLDGDDDLDLAVSNIGSNSISVLLNDGRGTFADQVAYSAGMSPSSVAIVDLDGDVDLDVRFSEQRQ